MGCNDFPFSGGYASSAKPTTIEEFPVVPSGPAQGVAKPAVSEPPAQDAPRRPLPCIVCGFHPKPAFTMDGGTHQPHAATMFDAGAGHYGSTVWDTMNPYRTLTINVCDSCLTRRSQRVAVVVTTPKPPEVQFVPWKAEEDDDV